MTAPRSLSVGASAAGRTLRAMIAVDLAVLPLTQLFTTQHWLIDAWITTALVALPAAAIRASLPARVWQTWLGVALTIPWLTLRFSSKHSVAGFVPTAATWRQVGDLFDQVRATTHNGVAPVPAGVAETFVLALVIGLFAALIDLVAVVGRRPALGGVPILVIFTVSGAVPRHAVAWPYFLASAAAFLILLSIDAGDTVHSWGRLIPRTGQSRARATLGVSGPRVAAIAMVVALLGAAVAPERPANVIANAFHHANHGDGTGTNGFGTGHGVSLDPFAALKGQLDQGKPTALFTVTLDRLSSGVPFYLRANVLSAFTANGWRPADHSGQQPAQAGDLSTDPPTQGTAKQTTFSATIDIKALSDNPPVFSRLLDVRGVDSDARWSSTDQLLVSPTVQHGQKIVEDVSQDEPSQSELTSAGPVDRHAMSDWLAVPPHMPTQVTSLVSRLTKGATTEYDIARALDNYFTDPANGFIYSLNATGGDSGNELVDFLQHKQGYCQQYAAALGIMLRIAGVPARVVLGYAHHAPDAHNTFTVTTSDAHAWVEAYFPGVGWEPFDATPLAGITGGQAADLPWAPHGAAPVAAPRVTASGPTASGNRKLDNLSTADNTSSGTSGTRTTTDLSWIVWPIAGAVLLALLGAPFATRWWRRRVRIRAARLGNPDPLWAELSATARDLGYVWSPSRTPRQVERWLASEVGPSRPALHNLTSAVEQARYAQRPAPERSAPQRSVGGTLVADLRAVETQLRLTRSRTTRIRSRVLPASLGWRLAELNRRLRRRAH